MKNETENSVRQAEYEAAKRKYEQDKQEHAKQMAERKRQQTAAWKAAQKKPAWKQPAAAATPASASMLALPGAAGGSASLAQGEAQQRIDLPAADPRRPMQQQSSGDDHPFLTPSVAAWAADVKRVAERCGALHAQRIWTYGMWFNLKEWYEHGTEDPADGRPFPLTLQPLHHPSPFSLSCHPNPHAAHHFVHCTHAGYNRLEDKFYDTHLPNYTEEDRKFQLQRQGSTIQNPN